MENEQELIIYEDNNSLSVIDKDAEEDLQEARETYKELIKLGKEGLKSAKELAEDSEHPRAIEVFAGLINSISDVNSKLVALHKTKKEITTPSQKGDSGGRSVTNNNVFVGSPADLQALLAGSNI
jgi:hypothetical protein